MKVIDTLYVGSEKLQLAETPAGHVALLSELDNGALWIFDGSDSDPKTAARFTERMNRTVDGCDVLPVLLRVSVELRSRGLER